MLLAPEHRTLYTDALNPPPGMSFDSALATTYSLDLITLMTIPAHLGLASSDDFASLLRDPILLLEALQRISSRLAVFCQEARVGIPAHNSLLVSLLEKTVVEVRAPNDESSFHPKLWVLRFRSNDGSIPDLLRLLVLSRNITADHCWDVSLVLEGSPKGRNHAVNAPLADLISRLPELAVRPGISPQVAGLAQTMADLVRRTEWELPLGFNRYEFIVLGMGKKSWRPPSSNSLLVISPFCRVTSLKALAQTTDSAVAVVSRPDELQRLNLANTGFQTHYCLEEAAEVEDGEACDGNTLHGLHAKCYVAERGWDVQYYVGSANATPAGIDGRNVEILVMLEGKRSQVGGINDLLGAEGFGKMLAVHANDDAQPEDPEEVAAEEAVAATRKTIAETVLRVRCKQTGSGWSLELEVRDLTMFSPLVSVATWPITLPDASYVDALILSTRTSLDFPSMALESLTGFIAFEVKVTGHPNQTIRFVLNLPLIDAPDDRLATIVRHMLKDEKGFIRYLQLLLSDDQPQNGEAAGSPGTVNGDNGTSRTSGADPALLEPLVRALTRHPERMKRAQQRIRELISSPDSKDIFPAGFIPLWESFESVLESKK